MRTSGSVTSASSHAGRWLRAEQIRNKAIFDQAVQAFVNREYEKSIGFFSSMIEENADDALAWVSRGAAQMRIENLDAALEDFNRAIALHPNRARPYHLWGLIYEKRGRLEEALEDFSHAIALDAEYGAALYSRAALFARMGDNQRAREDARAFATLTVKNVAEFSNENNVWRSYRLALEDGGIIDPIHR
ncbi:MAG: tetratricopeptide repeat protein [Desulfobacterales bacterium]|nr:tetratricopeptide repeat protein [Desulfobacterales bacterium]